MPSVDFDTVRVLGTPTALVISEVLAIRVTPGAEAFQATLLRGEILGLSITTGLAGISDRSICHCEHFL